jgi:hypothetical protein
MYSYYYSMYIATKRSSAMVVLLLLLLDRSSSHQHQHPRHGPSLVPRSIYHSLSASDTYVRHLSMTRFSHKLTWVECMSGMRIIVATRPLVALE